MSIDLNVNNILVIILAFCAILCVMYSIALVATYISFKLIEIGDIVYDSKWYTFPVSVRIYIQLFIQLTQRPRYFSGYQMIYCNLETFTKVNNECSKHFYS